MVRVKICGLTSLEDALAALDSGADALGFVLAESPRRVAPEQVREIIRRLPPFRTTVGVFVNEPPERIREIKSFCGLDLVQLHGEESEALAAGLGSGVIKALGVREDSPIDPAAYPLATLLLDAGSGRARGGTGQTFDWGLARAAAARRPIILAGGLDPENVGRAVEAVRPFAVDVSSGVETKPGRKDHAKLCLFVRRAKALD